jgi:hypothetical protein
MAEDHLAAPTPLEEHRRLAIFAGEWSGEQMAIPVRRSLRGNARPVHEDIDDNAYSMKIQFSPNAEGWADVLTGVYRRIH